MTTIKAFDGYLVKAEYVEQVVSPAYDSLTPEERHAFGESHPLNYINAMRSMDEYPVSQRPTQQEVLAINAENLRKLVGAGKFESLESPSMFVYRLSVNGHQQTAVVCEMPIDHYDHGDVLKHENTRSDKEDLLVDYLEVVGASSSPVCLAYQGEVEINALVDELTGSPPLFKFRAHDDVTQSLWKIDDESVIDRLTRRFSAVDRTYLTDGHHRFAAGSRFAAKKRAQHPDHSESEHFNHLLVALFPADQLRILPFNRCVKDLNGMNAKDFLARIARSFTIDQVDKAAAEPADRLQFGMWLENNWYRLRLKNLAVTQDPVESLDVTVLQNQILCPILGIEDVRSDERLDYISGVMGLSGLEQRGRDGWKVGFACYPTSIHELIQVADNGAVMPPKSTYFDPKLHSGIFLRLY